MKQAFKYAAYSLAALSLSFTAAQTAAAQEEPPSMPAVTFDLEDFQISDDVFSTFSPEALDALREMATRESWEISESLDRDGDFRLQPDSFRDRCSYTDRIDRDSLFSYQFQGDQRWRVDLGENKKRLLNISFMFTTANAARQERASSDDCIDRTAPYQGLLGTAIQNRR